jgi:hypothetical protein
VTSSAAPTTASTAPPIEKTGADGAFNVYGNTCCNLKKYGYVAEQGKALYINLNDAIYRQYDDGEYELLTRKDGNYINIVGNMLYYALLQGGIHSYDLSAGLETQLSKSKTSFMIATEEDIYYVNQDDNIRRWN